MLAQPTEFNFTIEHRQDGVAVFTASGEIDLACSAEFTKELTDLIDAGYVRLAIDTGELEFIDSTGLKAIVDTMHLARECDGDLVVVSPSGIVARVLQISGLTEAIRCFDHIDDALANLTPPPT